MTNLEYLKARLKGHADRQCELGSAGTLGEAVGKAINGVKAKVGNVTPIPVADEAMEVA